MTASNHTEHYGLSQYAQDDHPTYTGDYNGDMSRIDAALTAAVPQDATGLSVTQLDAQQTDDYNIVRVGKPTDSTESEESHHEQSQQNPPL